MRALIIAGGAGSRLNLGEKPLVNICGLPMISFIIDAFRASGFEVVVVTSPMTPMTQNWCRVNGTSFYTAQGTGYVEDMVEAVTALEEEQPLFISVSDIPCLDAHIIGKINLAYRQSGKEACSTWVPVSLVKPGRSDILYHEQINGIEAYPAGVNILRGDLIDKPQDELQFLLYEPRLAINVNTRDDLAAAETFISDSSRLNSAPD